jgi:hypothetical protein
MTDAPKTPGQLRALEAIARGSIADLDLSEDDVAGLEVRERLSLTKKVSFLRAFAVRGLILDGCQAAGVGRNSVKYWREQDDWFEELFQAALDEAADRLEREAHRRAVDGVDEPVVFQGMPTMLTDTESGEQKMFTVKKHSDKLLELLLKARRPEQFRENSKVSHNFEGQTGVLIVPAGVAPADWAKAAQEQQQRFAGNQGEEKKA